MTGQTLDASGTGLSLLSGPDAALVGYRRAALQQSVITYVGYDGKPTEKRAVLAGTLAGGPVFFSAGVAAVTTDDNQSATLHRFDKDLKTSTTLALGKLPVAAVAGCRDRIVVLSLAKGALSALSIPAGANAAPTPTPLGAGIKEVAAAVCRRPLASRAQARHGASTLRRDRRRGSARHHPAGSRGRQRLDRARARDRRRSGGGQLVERRWAHR